MKHIQSILFGILFMGNMVTFPSFLNSAVLEKDFIRKNSESIIRAKKENWRNYHQPVYREEKKCIIYIVKTLAYDSIYNIGKQKAALEDAGKKITHIHPFRFLETIFMNEELKAGIASIRNRISWIKDEFFNKTIESLKGEASRNNLFPFIKHFAKNLKIDEELITPALEKGKWKEFINLLIDNIPRENDPNRYNM